MPHGGPHAAYTDYFKMEAALFALLGKIHLLSCLIMATVLSVHQLFFIHSNNVASSIHSSFQTAACFY